MDNEDEQYFEIYNKLLKQAPEKADILVWLQGDRLDRGPKVLEMYKQKLAKLILISGNNSLIGPNTRPGEDNISLTEMYQWLIRNGISTDKIMIDDKSLNTKEQSINILKLAMNKKWQKIIIISSSYYQPRAFLTFIKTATKIGYDGKVVSQAVFINLETVPGGRSDTAQTLLKEEVLKVKQYQLKGDTASYEDGLNYLKN